MLRCTTTTALFSLALLALPLRAQNSPSSGTVESARALAGGMTVSAVRVGHDTLEIAFADATLTTKSIDDRTWSLGRSVDSVVLSPKSRGQLIARALWEGWAQNAGIRVIVVEVNGTVQTAEHAQVRLFYRESELASR